jgi:hypothetical protein
MRNCVAGWVNKSDLTSLDHSYQCVQEAGMIIESLRDHLEREIPSLQLI